MDRNIIRNRSQVWAYGDIDIAEGRVKAMFVYTCGMNVYVLETEEFPVKVSRISKL